MKLIALDARAKGAYREHSRGGSLRNLRTSATTRLMRLFASLVGLALLFAASAFRAPSSASSELPGDGGLGVSTTTTSTTTSSTSLPFDPYCQISFIAYGAVGIEQIELALNGGYYDPACSTPLDGVTIAEIGSYSVTGVLLTGLTARTIGDEDVLLKCGATIHHADYVPYVSQSWEEHDVVAAFDLAGRPVEPPLVCLSFDCNDYLGDLPERSKITPCGDATGDGTLGSSDALAVMRYALALDSGCGDRACDVDADGLVTTNDALRVLAASVGIAGSLRCEPPCGPEPL